MTLLLDAPDARVWHADWRELAAALPRREDGTVADLLVVDAPYSERTRKGHDSGVASTQGGTSFGRKGIRTGQRRSINYAAWAQADVDAFVSTWSPLTRGWFVTITDDALALVWQSALTSAGRYAFAALPFVSPGSRVRLTGDGPSSWTCWIIVARPSRPPFSKWGTTVGAYIFPPEDMPVVGGKPLALVRALVRDYSREGDVVCDPCGGAMTAGVAARLERRSFVGGDVDRGHAEMGAERLRDLPTAERAGTLALFAGLG